MAAEAASSLPQQSRSWCHHLLWLLMMTAIDRQADCSPANDASLLRAWRKRTILWRKRTNPGTGSELLRGIGLTMWEREVYVVRAFRTVGLAI
jgi:hypothetical protein